MALLIFMAFLWIINITVSGMPTCLVPISDIFALKFFVKL